jgi:hypothetical protein
MLAVSKMNRKQQLVMLVQTLVLADPPISATAAQTAVSLALRAVEERIPQDIDQAAGLIIGYARGDGPEPEWPVWIAGSW